MSDDPNELFSEDENRTAPPFDEGQEGTQETGDDGDGEKKSGVSADLIRGHINTIILRTLAEGDRYGYDIISEIEQKSHGQYSLKQPTLYSALKRLEAQGYVKSYWGGASGGGRRRYFSLTDEGRTVTRRNQEEWEYSRTIIDNLISDEEFDFSRPAPSKLDFRILRQTTSRTPIIEEELDAVPQKEQTQPAASSAETVTAAPTVEKAEIAEKAAEPVPAPAPNQKAEEGEKEAPLNLYITMEEEKRNYKDILGKIYRSAILQEPSEKKADTVAPESTPTPAPEKKTVAAKSEPEPAPAERAESVPLYAGTKPATSYGQATVAPPKIDFTDILEQARYEGLRVWTAGGATPRREMPEDFFDQGKALFTCGLIVLVVALLETLLCGVFRTQWHIGVLYTALMAIAPFVVFTVCLVLRLKRYRPCVRRAKNNSAIFNGVVAYVILFIVLLGVDLIRDVSFFDPIAVVKYLVIPAFYLLNVPLFFIAYYFLSKSKI